MNASVHSAHAGVRARVFCSNEVGGVDVEGRIGFWGVEEGNDSGAGRRESPCRCPLALEDVETDLAGCPGDIRVEDACCKLHSWWMRWVSWWDLDR